jgi:hypothetical protein
VQFSYFLGNKGQKRANISHNSQGLPVPISMSFVIVVSILLQDVVGSLF